jgi:hypothetical protein
MALFAGGRRRDRQRLGAAEDRIREREAQRLAEDLGLARWPLEPEDGRTRELLIILGALLIVLEDVIRGVHVRQDLLAEFFVLWVGQGVRWVRPR